MRAIYTKESYKHDGKHRFYWSKQGYLCNNLYAPHVRLTYYTESINKIKKKENSPLENHDDYLISIYDLKTIELIKQFNRFRYNSKNLF